MELEGLQCSTDQTLVGGHCVACDDDLCSTCTLTNTDGLVHGFYQDSVTGTCAACITDAEIDATTGKCTCSGELFYEGTSCVSCPDNCQTCSTSTACEVCNNKYEIDPLTSLCSEIICIDGQYFDSESNSCLSCGTTCATCLSADKCETCPAGFDLGDTLCLQCGERKTIEGDACVDCGSGCLECSSSSTCTTCEADATLGSDNTCSCNDSFYMDGQTC